MVVHVIRNAAIPILTTIGLSLRFALSSLPVVELYFGWFGVGLSLLKGISQQDTNLTIGLTLCLGVVFILVNLLLDLSYRIIDPRLSGKPEHIVSRERGSPIQTIKSAWSGLVNLLSDNPITNLFGRQKAEPDKPSITLKDSDNDYLTAEATSKSSLRGAWVAVLKNFPLILGGILVFGLFAIILFGPSLTPNNPFHT
jgi:hypothetical protein